MPSSNTTYYVGPQLVSKKKKLRKQMFPITFTGIAGNKYRCNQTGEITSDTKKYRYAQNNIRENKALVFRRK